MQTTRRRRHLGTTLAATALFLAAGAALAGAGDAKKPAKGSHLDYRRTYPDALLEARIRNMPIFFSRQKDD